MTKYLLDNAAAETERRFRALSALYDESTIRYLERCGVAAGWNCLEIGGGGGSIASWLANRVGADGRVLVTDLNPRFLVGMRAANLEVRKHNIVTDELAESDFDLIHARLVLMHIPEREQVLERLVRALKPGGCLIEEDFEFGPLAGDDAAEDWEVESKTQRAMFRIADRHGIDRRWGRKIFGRMRTLGLMDVRAEARFEIWRGGSPGTELLRANFEQMRGELVGGGFISEEDLGESLEKLGRMEFTARSPTMWTVWGYRAA